MSGDHADAKLAVVMVRQILRDGPLWNRYLLRFRVDCGAILENVRERGVIEPVTLQSTDGGYLRNQRVIPHRRSPTGRHRGGKRGCIRRGLSHSKAGVFSRAVGQCGGDAVGRRPCDSPCGGKRPVWSDRGRP